MYIYDKNQKSYNQIKKKEKKKKENKVNIYKSTFTTINNVIFIAIICFD